MGSKNVFALGFHADYRCRHSGACCTADWDVPVELPVYRSLSDALVGGRLRVAGTAGATYPFMVEPDLPEGTAAMLDRDERGRCVFYESTSRLCIVHRDLGEPYLPITCRHFPRVSVQDGRGTFVSLSHFCPTAASMLFSDGPVAIVAGPPAFPETDYDGLIVAADDLPPLLHPRVLMDLDGYTAGIGADDVDARRRPVAPLAAGQPDVVGSGLGVAARCDRGDATRIARTESADA
jgi:Fe-S-cluster containining protein